MPLPHRVFEGLLLLVWLAVLFGFARLLVTKLSRLRRGADLLAAASVVLFLFASSWHPTTRIEKVGAAGPVPPAQEQAGVGDAAHTVACLAGDREKGATIGHIDAVIVNRVQVATSGTIALRRGDALQIEGWIAADGIPAKNACIVIDGLVAPTTGNYGGARPDVANSLNRPALQNTAFALSTTRIRPGAHTLSVAATNGLSALAISQQIAISVR